MMVQTAMTQAIIPSAGAATRLEVLLHGSPKALVPVRRKPMLLQTMAQLVQQKVRYFVIVASPQGADAIAQALQRSFALPNITVRIAVQPEPLGPGHALFCATNELEAGSVLVALSDTVFRQELPLDGDWIGTAAVEPGGHWCRVEADERGQVQRLYDKCPFPEYVNMAAVGLYHFADSSLFSQCARQIVEEQKLLHGEYQISSILEEYQRHRPMDVYPVSTWMDCGDLFSLSRVNRSAFETSACSTIAVDRLGIISKNSENASIQNQNKWYQVLDGVSRVLAPRLVEVASSHKPKGYCAEHLDLPTLGSLYLYEPLTPAQMRTILADFMEIMQDVIWPTVKHDRIVDLVERCRYMYIDKTLRRFEQCSLGQALGAYSTLQINGNHLVGPRAALDYLVESLDRVARDPLPGFVHGDLNFSNILYSLEYGYFRMIDPRGDFAGAPELGGDIRYDLSKLRHSYHGLYEAIVNDLFTVEETGAGCYDFHLGVNREAHSSSLDGLIETMGYDLHAIELIEASLFLSMLPLHANHPNRQLAFLFTGLQMLTEHLMNDRIP